MYVKLCSVQDVPIGDIRQFDLKDEEILVVNLNGGFYCLEARCTHAGAPLAEGEMEGDILVCPWHHSRFRVTDGSVVNSPARASLKVYKSQIKDGHILIEFQEAED
jgi:nitrite reductase/ring-hydroxylating ferredoxin subunit